MLFIIIILALTALMVTLMVIGAVTPTGDERRAATNARTREVMTLLSPYTDDYLYHVLAATNVSLGQYRVMVVKEMARLEMGTKIRACMTATEIEDLVQGHYRHLPTHLTRGYDATDLASLTVAAMILNVRAANARNARNAA